MREVEVSEAPPPAGTAPGSRRRRQNPPKTREVSPVSSENPTAIPPADSQDDSKMKVRSPYYYFLSLYTKYHAMFCRLL